jgi:arylsulfatase A-like enzyme
VEGEDKWQRKRKKPIGDTQGRPNILVIFGDDIGITNLSCYSDGLMGYETPNIDRIAKEASAFDTTTASNRAPPGAPIGMSQLDPSIGGLLKNVGYATGQFGKNHVGDRNETLPTVNGFNEFFGNLYHLNAEEEPELPDYPKDPAYRAKFGPRGVLKCKATRQGRAHHRSAVREDRQADH